MEISDPLLISEGSNVDAINLVINHPIYFESVNGSTLDVNDGDGNEEFELEITYDLPKMLPDGIDAEIMAVTA